jgi:hypothetical protein
LAKARPYGNLGLEELQRSYHSKPTLPVPSLNKKDAAQKYTPNVKTQNKQNIESCHKKKPQRELICETEN